MLEGIEFVCPHCARTVSPGDGSNCPAHPETTPELSYDIGHIRERFDPATRDRPDLWRYCPLLPVAGSNPVTLGEGWTDLVEAPTTGAAIGVNLGLKLEGSNPTGAAKDRGSAVVATYACEQQFEKIICASTGNAAASIAAYAARGNLDCSLFVPERLPEAKAVQPLVYDAQLVTVAGGYAAAYRQCRERATNGDVLDRSAGSSPYTPAGTQTLGFELAEQAADADWIAVSMGNGGTLADIWQGLRLFTTLGYLADPPKLLGVQATGSSPIHDQLQSDDSAGETAQQPAGTCADSIDVDKPRRTAAARQAIEESNGRTLTVSDEAIRTALSSLGRNEGLFVEPAGAAAVAGIDRAVDRGIVDRNERVVAVLTGNGLKDTQTALDAVEDS